MAKKNKKQEIKQSKKRLDRDIYLDNHSGFLEQISEALRSEFGSEKSRLMIEQVKLFN
jgi:uncharacterized protein YcgL (UPF0745 family)